MTASPGSRPADPSLWLPPPREIDDAPELAVLAALRASLDIVESALVSACPHLAVDPLPPYPEVTAARVILLRAEKLRRAVDDYRAAVAAIFAPVPDGPGDDIPF